MTEIDLTPQNEASARALFAEQFAAQQLASNSVPADERGRVHLELREGAKDAWDRGDVPHRAMIHYRELALAATLTTYRSTARQVWDQAIQHAVDTNMLSTLAGLALKEENPYREETTP